MIINQPAQGLNSMFRVERAIEGFNVIGRLRGIVLEKQPPIVLLELQGVGYEVHMPMTCFYELPEIGQEAIVLHILLYVKMPNYCMALTISKKGRYLKS